MGWSLGDVWLGRGVENVVTNPIDQPSKETVDAILAVSFINEAEACIIAHPATILIPYIK